MRLRARRRPSGVNDQPLPRRVRRQGHGYLVYWNDYSREQLYVFDRPVFESADVGQALLNLELDLGADIDTIFDSDETLQEAVNRAAVLATDPTKWTLATRNAIRGLMGAGPGALAVPGSGTDLPNCRPPIAAGGVQQSGTDTLPADQPTATVSIPDAPPAGTLPDDMIGGLLLVIGCEGNGGSGGCVCCIFAGGSATSSSGPPCCGSSCDDGNACTVNDTCDLFCSFPSDPAQPYCCGIPKNCDDNNRCTGDSCSNGICTHTFLCDDGDPCTIDTCSGGSCSNTLKDCDDGDPCTSDVCGFATGICQHVFFCGDRACCPDSGLCCPLAGMMCCNNPGFDHCCLTDQTCCGEGCCDTATEFCCPSGDRCCPLGTTCCGTLGCCEPDQPCCDGLCCDDGNACTDNVCTNGVCEFPPKDCDDGDPCTNDSCDLAIGCQNMPRCPNSVCCTNPDRCCPLGTSCCGTTGCCLAGQNCCANDVCCDLACEECLDNGALSGGIIDVSPNPACLNDTITFTLSGVVDNGGIKRVDCVAKTAVPAVTPDYTWTLSLPAAYPPPLPPLTGSGAVVTVIAKAPGIYSVTFMATANRECPPPDITIGPATAEVASIVTVAWEAIVGNDGLGADPNNGGKRIFPGKRLPVDVDAAQRPKVIIKATISPVAQGGCTVHFKTWDVDDPFDQNNPAMPNVSVIDGNTSGPDNRGADPAVGQWSAVTDANGEASVTVTVSMQPGNNYRGGASVVQSAINGTTQAEADSNSPPQHVKFTQMLTVWRKLHVETDSMGPVTGNEIDGPFTDIVGSGTALTEVLGLVSLDDGSKDLDDTPRENGRFENGTLLVGSTPTAITISPVTGNGNSRVVFPAASIAGLSFSAIDNDFLGNGTMSGTITQVTKSGSNFVWTLTVTAHNETPIDWVDFIGGTLRVSGGAAVGITGSSGTTSTGTLATSGLNIPCVVKDDDDNTLLPKFPDTSQLPAAYKPAYVEPVFDVGDNNLAVPFVLNIGTFNSDITAAIDWDSRSINTSDFWVAYILTGFQGETIRDSDAFSEGSTFGRTNKDNGGSLIFLEVHQTHEGIPNPTAEERDTVVHETGHAVGNSGDEPVTDGAGRFNSVYLKVIRSSIKPAS